MFGLADDGGRARLRATLLVSAEKLISHTLIARPNRAQEAGINCCRQVSVGCIAPRTASEGSAVNAQGRLALTVPTRVPPALAGCRPFHRPTPRTRKTARRFPPQEHTPNRRLLGLRARPAIPSRGVASAHDDPCPDPVGSAHGPWCLQLPTSMRPHHDTDNPLAERGGGRCP